MNNSRNPIIFCHYGDSTYLVHTLTQVKSTNPENRVILLGDKKNKAIAESTGAEHYFFKDYNNSAEILNFEKVYQHVAGKNHGKKYWTKFVFKRWFHIHEFIKKENINSFWHFDSDNMILSNLNNQENKFRHYDCTEQCNGICMNGFISSFKVVDGYVKKINELFENDVYLNKQREDFIKNPHHAFTEMRAYKTFKEQENIKSIRLNSIINSESFDDCICQCHGFEMCEYPLNGRYLKKIYIDTAGDFYCYHIKSSKYIKMNSLNLSWVPNGLFEFILKTSTSPPSRNKNSQINVEGLSELDFRFLTNYKSALRSRIKKMIQNSAHQNIKAIIKRLLY